MQQTITAETARSRQTRGVRKLSCVAACGVALLLVGSAAMPTSLAKGRKPEDVYKGQIALSEQPFPARFSSNDKFVEHIKRARQAEFWPASEGGAWQIEYMAFFAKPLPSHTYSVVYFDVTEKNNPQFVLEGTSTPQKNGLRIMAGFTELKPPHFQADHRYLMLYTPNVNQPALAEVEFVLRPYDPKRAAEARERREAALREQVEADKAAADKEQKDKPAQPAWVPPNW